MKPFAVGALLLLAACSSHAAYDVPPAPWDYPAGSGLVANLGVGSSMVGAELLQSSNSTKRAVGTGFSGAGAVGLGIAAAQADLAGQNRDRRMAAEELGAAVDAFFTRRDLDRLPTPRDVTPPADTRPKADSPLAPQQPK